VRKDGRLAGGVGASARDVTGFPPAVTAAPGDAANVATPFSSRIVPRFAGAFPEGRRTRLFGALPTGLSPSESHERPTSDNQPDFDRRRSSRRARNAAISAS